MKAVILLNDENILNKFRINDIKIYGKTIFDYQREILNSLGFQDIIVTKEKNITNIEEDILLIEGNVIFERELILKLLEIGDSVQLVRNDLSVGIWKIHHKKKDYFRNMDIGDYFCAKLNSYDEFLKAFKHLSSFDLSLKSIKLAFIDLDGTIYLGDNLINNADKFINLLRANNIYFYFLSNNSSKSKKDYVMKLANLGIMVSEENIILSTDGLIDYLKEKNVKKVYTIGTEAMKEQIRNSGIIPDSEDPEFVVLGYDTEITYEKLKKGAIFLQKGINLLATHCDKVCPSPEGFLPDVGAFLALFETATSKKPLKIFGKPNIEMIDSYIKRHKVSPSEVVIIGDRIYTDMQLAKNIGSKFILVLSGETKLEDVFQLSISPDLIIKNVGELVYG